MMRAENIAVEKKSIYDDNDQNKAQLVTNHATILLMKS